jgi:putative oxidoreductase
VKNLAALIAKSYGWLACGASLLKSPLLLVIRLYWGWQTSLSGYGHLTHVPDMIENFKKWHIPFPEVNVYLSGCTELVLGMFLLLGLASRIITIPLIVNFMVAYLTASHDTIQQSLAAIFTKPDDFLTDTSFQFLFASVIVFVFGPGVFSLDWAIGRFCKKKSAA